LKADMSALGDAIKKQDSVSTLELDEKCAEGLYQQRLSKLPKASLPYTIPDECLTMADSNVRMPVLKGRAVVEMTVQTNHPRGWLTDDLGGSAGKPMGKEANIRIIIDGLHAPLTGGNFVDLVNKGFYNNMPIQRDEELTEQFGQPKGADGYVDPRTKKVRNIPLELFYKKDTAPTYGITSDDDNRGVETPALPFQAYGAVGMARGNEDPDSASSQVFFLKWDQGLIAPGRNTLDGFYTCMGYIVENQHLVGQMDKGTTIVSAKVLSGIEDLIQ